MFKPLTVLILFLTAFTLAPTCHSFPIKSLTGTVVMSDVEGGIIDIKTDSGTQRFNVGAESQLFISTRHTSAIEIEKKDPVKIDYTIDDSGKKNIVKLVDLRDEH